MLENEIHLAWRRRSYVCHVYVWLKLKVILNDDSWQLHNTSSSQVENEIETHNTNSYFWNTQHTCALHFASLQRVCAVCVIQQKKANKKYLCLLHKYMDVYWPRIVCHWNIYFHSEYRLSKFHIFCFYFNVKEFMSPVKCDKSLEISNFFDTGGNSASFCYSCCFFFGVSSHLLLIIVRMVQTSLEGIPVFAAPCRSLHIISRIGYTHTHTQHIEQ